MENANKVLLLLSGGKDSLAAIPRLVAMGYQVEALCIDGIQGTEKHGAKKAAKQYGVPLVIKSIPYFDEETWHPAKLIVRDLALGVLAIHRAKQIRATGIATGVKLLDLQNPKLGWLRYFLKFAETLLAAFRLKLIFPVWDDSVSESQAQTVEPIDK